METALLICGGDVNSAYLQLLETQVSELLYHIEIWHSVAEIRQPKEEKGLFGDFKVPGV